jgi:hypothetical protein
MDEQLTAGPGLRAPDLAPAPPAVPEPRSPDDPVQGGWHHASRMPARQPLVRRPGPATRGDMVPSDEELLERTLRFSGSYVSDDGHVRIRRSSGAVGYSAATFLGYCDTCALSVRTPAGEPLADVTAVSQFIAAHDHGDVD